MILVDGGNAMERGLDREADASGASPGLRMRGAGEGLVLCTGAERADAASLPHHPPTRPATQDAAGRLVSLTLVASAGPLGRGFPARASCGSSRCGGMVPARAFERAFRPAGRPGMARTP